MNLTPQGLFLHFSTLVLQAFFSRGVTQVGPSEQVARFIEAANFNAFYEVVWFMRLLVPRGTSIALLIDDLTELADRNPAIAKEFVDAEILGGLGPGFTVVYTGSNVSVDKFTISPSGRISFPTAV